jgi:hypothetical protein
LFLTSLGWRRETTIEAIDESSRNGLRILRKITSGGREINGAIRSVAIIANALQNEIR